MMLRHVFARHAKIPQRPFNSAVPMKQLTKPKGLASLNSNKSNDDNQIADKKFLNVWALP